MSCSMIASQCQTALCSTPWNAGNTANNKQVVEEFCTSGLPGFTTCGLCTKYYGDTCCTASDPAKCFVDLQMAGQNCNLPGNTLSGGVPPPPISTTTTYITTTYPTTFPSTTPKMYNTTSIIVPPPIHTTVPSISTGSTAPTTSSTIIIVPPPINATTLPNTSTVSSTPATVMSTVMSTVIATQPTSEMPTPSAPATSVPLPSQSGVTIPNDASAPALSLRTVMISAGVVALMGLNFM